MWTALKRDISFLYLVLIKPFYLENSGLLFAVFFICFGLFPGFYMLREAHGGMMYAICTSPAAMLATFLLWSAYAFKCISFVLRELKLPQNTCLYIFGLGKKASLVFLFLVLQLSLFIPVLLYALFTLYIGFSSGNYVQPFFIIMFLSGLNLVSSYLYFHEVRNPQQELKLPFQLPVYKRTWTEPFYLFPLTHFLNKRKLMLLVIKSISLLLLWGGFYLADRQALEVRFVYMMMVGSVIAHSILVQHLRDFENRHMHWMLNLAVSPATRFAGYVMFFTVILTPEFFFLSKYTFSQIQIYDLPYFLILGISGLCYLHSLLFLKNMNETTYMNYVFGSWLGLTMAVQFTIPIFVISAALFTTAFIIYRRRYYLYDV